MAELRKLWVSLKTADRENAGTDADFYIEFLQSGKSFKLPDQPGDDLEQAASTTYIFHINNLATEDFVPGTVILRNDNSGDHPGWRCKAILVVGIAEDGKYYPLVAMDDVDRWLAADEPEGLTLPLDILKADEIGVVER